MAPFEEVAAICGCDKSTKSRILKQLLWIKLTILDINNMWENKIYQSVLLPCVQHWKSGFKCTLTFNRENVKHDKSSSACKQIEQIYKFT